MEEEEKINWEELSSIELKSALAKLEKSLGWKYLVKILEEQIHAREQQILVVDLDDPKDIAEARKQKAERGTMKLLVMLPEVLIQNLEEEISEQTDSPE